MFDGYCHDESYDDYYYDDHYYDEEVYFDVEWYICNECKHFGDCNECFNDVF
eukprot:m.32411 g.32411  ORF g.32411 m.32411 type:complete len:52 (+) comp31652_c0_seq1:913-1068(+)